MQSDNVKGRQLRLFVEFYFYENTHMNLNDENVWSTKTNGLLFKDQLPDTDNYSMFNAV